MARVAGFALDVRVRRHRFALQGSADAFAWLFGLLFADLLRHDLSMTGVDGWSVITMAVVAVLIQLAVGSAFGLYIGRWLVGSFDEVESLTAAVALTTAALFVVNLATGLPLPRSVVIGGGIVALVASAGFRLIYRHVVEHRGAAPLDAKQRLLVFGAGNASYGVIRALQTSADREYEAVAVLDDDPMKRNRRVHGVPVVGSREHIAEAARRFGASVLLIAIPSAPASLISEITDLALHAGLAVKTVPSIGQLMGTNAEVSDIRDVTEEDLLGRRRVRTDIGEIADYITGKRVLVTGAGGSIGSELCRQLYRFAPAELIMLDRDESALHGVQMSIEGRALLDSDDLVLHDIRDRFGLDRIFCERRPDVVFHAAALKHLPLLERHPVEAIKTNIWGTLALLDAAAEHGVERFVNVSTDKAADPTSVLGYSKRICERLTAYYAARSAQPYLSVRFGNVLGSRGSVLGAFRAQIEMGGPLTVTHADATRYFMTVEEAVQLVIQAGAIGRPGEALVLDMGEPVRIAEVARLLASRSSQPIDIVYTGLRPGEKLHEDLMGWDEEDVRPFHPLISHVPVPELDPDHVQRFNPADDRATTMELLRALCDESLAGRYYR